MKIVSNILRVATINITRKLSKEQQIILGHLTYSTSKLWNVANYEIHNQNVNLYELKQYMKDNFWYKNLHSQSAQAILEKLEIAWKNFFNGYTKRPHYQPPDGHIPVKWKKDGFKVINKRLRLSLSKQTKQYLASHHGIESNYLWIDLPKNLSLNPDGIKEIEIVPHESYGSIEYVLHIIYEKHIKNYQIISNKKMAIDLGITNLATVVIENEDTPYIFDGKVLVSKLRWVAKEKGRLQSILAKQKLKKSKKLHRLNVKTLNYKKDYIHKVSTNIVRLAVAYQVDQIIIGKLNHGITHINIGHQTNEKLHQIPLGKLVKMIQYKAREYGIKVIQIDESYTSQECSCCNTRNRNHRVYRGLYVCSHCGLVINADVNGARNILQRVSLNPDNHHQDRSSGLGHPKRIRVA